MIIPTRRPTNLTPRQHFLLEIRDYNQIYPSQRICVSNLTPQEAAYTDNPDVQISPTRDNKSQAGPPAPRSPITESSIVNHQLPNATDVLYRNKRAEVLKLRELRNEKESLERKQVRETARRESAKKYQENAKAEWEIYRAKRFQLVREALLDRQIKRGNEMPKKKEKERYKEDWLVIARWTGNREWQILGEKWLLL